MGLKNPVGGLLKKISGARREDKMECWSHGILEYWGLKPVTPLLHYSGPALAFRGKLPCYFQDWLAGKDLIDLSRPLSPDNPL